MTDRLDHDAIERVVKRAAEMDDDDPVIGGVEVDAVVAAAEEVGISPDAIRTSIALERLGPEPPPARLDRMVGAREVIGERRVAFAATDAFDLLDLWLRKGHHLRREQRQGETAHWRRRSDMAAGVARTTKSFMGEAGLSTVRLITAQVAPIDESSSMIRIVADRSAGRSTAIGLSSGLTVVSVTGAAVMAVVIPPLAIVGVPGLAAAGATSAGAKRSATNLEREIIRLLDQIAEGREPGRRRRSPRLGPPH